MSEGRIAAGEVRRVVVDRFEGEFAVLEAGGAVVDVPRWLLPPKTREGDVLEVVREGEVARLRLDRAATEAARQEAEALLERLRSRDPGGDVIL